MERLHDRLSEQGQLALRLEARSSNERRLVDAAAQFLGDESLEPAFSHPGLCLTVLPHRERPAREIWRRENGPVSLSVQPTADQAGVFHGVPHGAKARLILLYLQTEAVKTNSRQIELGRSMHAGSDGWALSHRARIIQRSIGNRSRSRIVCLYLVMRATILLYVGATRS